MLKLDKVLIYLKNRLLYNDYSRQIVGENVDYFGDLWHSMGGEMSNHCTALLVRRLERGFKNKYEEQGYREGLAALSKLYSSCAAQKAIPAQKERKLDERKPKVKRSRLI